MSGPQDPAEQARAEMISDAVELALMMTQEGTGSLTNFLADVAGEVGDSATRHLRGLPSTEISKKGGQLAGEVVTVALDVADAARDGLTADPKTRDRTVDLMSQAVSFFGSMFIDTANKAVGTSAGQPATNRARLVTVTLDPGKSGKASVWVVNRSDIKVTDAPIEIAKAEGEPIIQPSSPTLTIAPGDRARIDLTVNQTAMEPGSFTDALLIVRGVGSIVVRTVVRKQAAAADEQPDDDND